MVRRKRYIAAPVLLRLLIVNSSLWPLRLLLIFCSRSSQQLQTLRVSAARILHCRAANPDPTSHVADYYYPRGDPTTPRRARPRNPYRESLALALAAHEGADVG